MIQQQEEKLRNILRHRPGLKVLFGYLGIVFFAISPLVPTLFAASVGALFGCNINEASTDSCVRLGVPLGDILSAVGVFFWFGLLTVPLAILFAIAWTILSIKNLFFQKR